MAWFAVATPITKSTFHMKWDLYSTCSKFCFPPTVDFEFHCSWEKFEVYVRWRRLLA